MESNWFYYMKDFLSALIKGPIVHVRKGKDANGLVVSIELFVYGSR